MYHNLAIEQEFGPRSRNKFIRGGNISNEFQNKTADLKLMQNNRRTYLNIGGHEINKSLIKMKRDYEGRPKSQSRKKVVKRNTLMDFRIPSRQNLDREKPKSTVNYKKMSKTG